MRYACRSEENVVKSKQKSREKVTRRTAKRKRRDEGQNNSTRGAGEEKLIDKRKGISDRSGSRD